MIKYSTRSEKNEAIDQHRSRLMLTASEWCATAAEIGTGDRADRRPEVVGVKAHKRRPNEGSRFGSSLPTGARTFAAVLGLLLITATGAAAGEDRRCAARRCVHLRLCPVVRLRCPGQVNSGRRSSAIGCIWRPVPACSTNIFRSRSATPTAGVFFPVDGICLIPPHAREHRDWVFQQLRARRRTVSQTVLLS